MFDPETRRMLESGCALIVGTVAPDGAPHASRAWGLTILEDRRVRLLVDGDDLVLAVNLTPSGAIAITGCDVPSLCSIQLKGSATAPVPTDDPADLDRAARFCEAFYGDVARTEGTPLALLERLTPRRFAVCTVDVDQVFDQTPGPAAGNLLEPTR